MNNPKHIAFIMDGNGRWAQKQGLPRAAGHIKGVKTMESIVKACFNNGVGVVSVFALSTENWKRPADEVNKILELLGSYVGRLGVFEKNNIRLVFSGDLTRFPEELKQKILNAETRTKAHTGGVLNIAANYGGRQEILRAVNLMLSAGIKECDEEKFRSFLNRPELSDPDLIIRTGGEGRISNYYLYQAAYSEIYFSKTLWPDFTVKELKEILADFKGRERRFGALS